MIIDDIKMSSYIKILSIIIFWTELQAKRAGIVCEDSYLL